MKKHVIRRIVLSIALTLIASYLGIYYLFWRDSFILEHVFRWDERFESETVAFIPLIWIDRRIEARRDANRYGEQYAGTWVAEPEDSSGMLKLQISRNFEYVFTLDYRGTTYTSKGTLEDNFLEDSFSCWTDSRTDAYLALGPVYEGVGRNHAPSDSEIHIAVAIKSYGHITDFDRAIRLQNDHNNQQPN